MMNSKRSSFYRPVSKDTIIYRAQEFNPTHFFNRDLSWLEFNYRVLHEALDERTPLLERLKFFDIFRSNNDEFFMKRVGALMDADESQEQFVTIDGKTPSEVNKYIRELVFEHLEKLSSVFNKSIIPSLEEKGVKLVSWKDISKVEKESLMDFFSRNIFPILTPLAVDSGHPFPFLSNLSKSIGVSLKKPNQKDKLFARVKVPSEIPQWLSLPPTNDFPHRFINIEEIIIHNLKTLFPEMEIKGTMIFRVTRNAGIQNDDEDADNLRELVQEDLKERRFAPVVRLEYQRAGDPWILDFLLDELELKEESVYPMDSLPNYSPLSKLYDININSERYWKYPYQTIQDFQVESDVDFDIFSVLRKKDVMLHFPYQSFHNSIEHFIESAADDPKVRAIKVILYRTDTEGRLINTLIRAAENKKQVACIIELKARFDEEKNIHWASKLEEMGIHVTYGLLGLKTHAKLIMVVREDHDGLRTYVNIGTGNFNSQTSKLYTDLSLLTCESKITTEVIELFNFLTGRSLKKDYEKLLVAPYTMREKLNELIDYEIKMAKKGKTAHIIAKMNSLEDPEIIERFYEASQAGVKIDLLVRGFCCLRPGVKDLSENIRIYSIVGRLLEHSRIYYFSHGNSEFSKGRFFIGSADLMHRNLNDRVEVISPVEDKEIKKSLGGYLNLCLSDNRHLWELDGNTGKYKQRQDDKNPINSQLKLLTGDL